MTASDKQCVDRLPKVRKDGYVRSLEDLKAGRVVAYNFGNTQRAEGYDGPGKFFEGDQK